MFHLKHYLYHGSHFLLSDSPKLGLRPSQSCQLKQTLFTFLLAVSPTERSWNCNQRVAPRWNLVRELLNWERQMTDVGAEGKEDNWSCMLRCSRFGKWDRLIDVSIKVKTEKDSQKCQ